MNKPVINISRKVFVWIICSFFRDGNGLLGGAVLFFAGGNLISIVLLTSIQSFQLSDPQEQEKIV